MTDITEKPLVSFVVIAYNQERFIREAIEGAFAQTYEPLEIILSDDGSPDHTFEIMQEMAAAYDGPHTVRLNRNEPNLGLVPHFDRVMELVQGEFIIVNAGDDVSLPERTEKLADIWWSSPKEVKLVHSATTRIDLCGSPLQYRAPKPEIQKDVTPSEIIVDVLCVIGATAGWTRDVFSDFGPLGPNLLNEDHIIPFRAAILGRLEYTPEALVKYREGGVSERELKSPSYDYLYGFPHKIRNWDSLVDLHILDNSHKYDYPRKAATEDVCRRRVPIMRFMVDLAVSSPLKRWAMLPRAVRLSLHHRNVRHIKDWVLYTFDVIYLPYAAWRDSKRDSLRNHAPNTKA